MLSFKIITAENKEELKETLSVGLTANEKEELCEIIASVDLSEDDVEYAIAVSQGCVLLRVFDMGRYFFVFPIEISDTARHDKAIECINEYARFEEIDLTFVDVPGEALSSFVGFRHMDVDAEDREASTYRVRIKTECDFLTEIPSYNGDRVKLNALTEADIHDYARLSKDKNVNKYWGYKYSDDVKSPSDEYFFENARGEFASHISLTMAIRVGDKFVGEAILYAFDGRGRADVAIRILPEYQRQGYAREALCALVGIAEKIGLTSLRAKIKSENTPSLSLFENCADLVSQVEGTHEFKIEIG